METILFIVIFAVSIVLISAARNFGQKHIWGPLSDKMEKKTMKELQEQMKKDNTKKDEEDNEETL